MRGNCVLLLLLSLLLLSTPKIFVRGQHDDDEAEEEEEEEQSGKTEHALLMEELGMDFSDLGLADDDEDPRLVARRVVRSMMEATSLEDRLTTLFSTKAKSPECRAKIARHFSYFVEALGREEPFPFSDVRFENECPEPVYDDWNNLPEGMHIGHIQNRTYQPPRNETEYIDDPAKLKLCYG